MESQTILTRLDPRLLVLLCSLGGLCAWLAPWTWTAPLLLPALCLALNAWRTLPGGRVIAVAQIAFILLWGLGFLGFRAWEAGEIAPETVEQTLIFCARLGTMLGLALAIPLALTPLALGRVMAWGLRKLGAPETAWRAALALVIMLSFLPKGLRALSGLNRSLRLRVPNLPRRRAFFLLGLASLRLLGVQTWEISLAIAGRDLYRPGPWLWRSPYGRSRIKPGPRKE
ncbi:MAG: hypothetical protein FWF99_00230 [Desulfovibrionaceae bacterium]|nr:hypothetical protein [Desulfovibrionaceae bacterium]